MKMVDAFSNMLNRNKQDKPDEVAIEEVEDWCEEEDCSERISAYDAALIWLSSGQDEDYTSGYSEDELRNAL